jgi:hypothetical protein
MSGLIKNPEKFNPKDLSRFQIKNVDNLAGPLDYLRKNHPEIAEQFLTQDTFLVYADPKTSLEGYIYEQFKKNEPFDVNKLNSLPIRTNGTLQIIIREIYMKKPERLAEIQEIFSKRIGSDSDRKLLIVLKLLDVFDRSLDNIDLYT